MSQVVSAWNSFEATSVAKFAAVHAEPGMAVLDVGGRVIQGGARGTFTRLGCSFTSLDIQADKSVDVVSPPGEPFPFKDGAFDIVITTSTFEHDPMFWMTIREMARVTRTNGWVYATSPHMGHYHPYPGDNYRFMHDAAAALAFWTGKPINGHAYPLELNATWLGRGGSFIENVMVWKRTTTAATKFTLSALGLSHGRVTPQEPSTYNLTCSCHARRGSQFE